eukprot:m.219104 g.219104  ORF g.219104 m.219104 type:complete len:860 (-) comp33288_c4_seq1:71-2650(-)
MVERVVTWFSFMTFMIMTCYATVALCSNPLTVVNSLDPVLRNETVVSAVPGWSDILSNTRVHLCAGDTVVNPVCSERDEQCMLITPTHVAPGVVHWIVPTANPLTEYRYRISTDSTATAVCTPWTSLNTASVWWSQCVGKTSSSPLALATGGTVKESPPLWHNGLSCSPGVSTLRIFGKSISFSPQGVTTPYASDTIVEEPTMLRLTPLNRVGDGGNDTVVVVAATSQSGYDAMFPLPSSITPGNYTIEVKTNLPHATWVTPRDPDQQTLTLTSADMALPLLNCSATASPTQLSAHDRDSLVAALAEAAAHVGATTIITLTAGTFEMLHTDALRVPDCVLVRGSGMQTTRLVWPNVSTLCATLRAPLISPAPNAVGAITVSDLAIEVSSGGFLPGCTGLLGGHGYGMTFQRLNLTVWDMHSDQIVFGSIFDFENAKYFLIEDCVILHCGNSTPRGPHDRGANSPILNLAQSSNGVIRNNLWQVGLTGWHMDKSWHIVVESNIFTGFFDNDVTRPLPHFDGAFWFSSYGQGMFPGAGRFFYANTTQNERPHSKPQIGGGESFTLDGGNDGGYYGNIAKSAFDDTGKTVTTAGDVCWHHVGGYTAQDCSTNAADKWPGGKTGHAAIVLTGPARGQWRRVVGVGGFRNRTISVDTPFDPAPTSASTVQIGQFRGQILIVGGDFVAGGTMQLYAACYDCVVAENKFRDFGFTNWGLNPHGAGWQPNLNNLMVDNAMLGPRGVDMGVLHCSQTCSDAACGNCYSFGHGGSPPQQCSGNTTSMLGRCCAADASNMGAFVGSLNVQVAWRRNRMQSLFFGSKGDSATIAVADTGLVEHTHWTFSNSSAPPPHFENLAKTTNIVVRD